MTAQRLISRAEFARLCNISGAAVTKQCRPGGALVGCSFEKLIDLDHEDAQKYIEFKKTGNRCSKKIDKKPAQKRQAKAKPKQKATKPPVKKTEPRNKSVKTQAKQAKPAPKKKEPVNKEPETVKESLPPEDNQLGKLGIEALPEDVMEMADMPFRYVVSSFATSAAMKNYVQSLKTMEQVEAERIKNAKSRGLLVSRELVAKGVIVPVNMAHSKLLSAGAKQLSQRISAKAKSGASQQECEKVAKKIIAQFLEPVAEGMRGALSDD